MKKHWIIYAVIAIAAVVLYARVGPSTETIGDGGDFQYGGEDNTVASAANSAGAALDSVAPQSTFGWLGLVGIVGLLLL